jgi:hypothetical protein
MVDATIAAKFYSEREVEPPSIDALIAAAKGRLRRSIPRWLKREELPGLPADELHYYFRGHADSTWGLSSTLYRLVQDVTRVTETRLIRAEAAVLNEMRCQGLGSNMTDGELLMVLQHHAIPTRLIDFCRSSLPALYFATERLEDRDGRLFMVGHRADVHGQYPELLLGDDEELPWIGAASGYARRQWSNSVAFVADLALDPRMRAQDGCFLVGGLANRFAGENMTVMGEPQPVRRWPEVSTLKIYFPLPGAKKRTSARWPAVGWTVRIPAEWKSEIRERLRDEGITTDHMYPDYDGSRRLGAFIATRALEG